MKSEPYERERVVRGKSEDLQNNIGDDAKDAVISSNNNNLKNFLIYQEMMQEIL